MKLIPQDINLASHTHMSPVSQKKKKIAWHKADGSV